MDILREHSLGKKTGNVDRSLSDKTELCRGCCGDLEEGCLVHDMETQGRISRGGTLFIPGKRKTAGAHGWGGGGWAGDKAKE